MWRLVFSAGLVLALVGSPEGSRAEELPEVVVELIPSQPHPAASRTDGEPVEDRAILSLRDGATGELESARNVVPGDAVTFVAEPGTYRLSLEGSGWWAPERLVEIPPEVESVRVSLPLWRTGSVRGRMIARGEPRPAGVRASFREVPAPGARDGTVELAGVGFCSLEEQKLSCELPVGVLDLRIESDGFAPVHRWGVEVKTGGAAALGDLHLVPGGFVTGTVLDRRTMAPVEAAVIELRPTGLTADRSPTNRERAVVRRYRTTTDARGFFQVPGVRRGAYRVWVSHGDFAEGALATVEVAEAREHRLEDPLLLAPPASLEVLLTPPLDPYDQPWRVRLARHVRGVEHESVRNVPATASASGAWTADGLAPGTYLIRIGNDLDPSWRLERVEIEAGHEVFDVFLDAVPVEGRLTLGGEPLPGTLWFGGRHGEESIRFDADPAGEFRGYLPHEGEWPIELSRIGWRGVQSLEPVTVARSSGQKVARVDVELPDTTLRGRVIDTAGEPQPQARLLAVKLEAGRRELSEVADDEGRFEFRGLAPGTITLRAESSSGSSDWVPVRLEDGEEGPEITLRIADHRRIHGRVSSLSGPVADATLQLIPAFSEQAPSAVIEVNTAVDGTFEARVPAHVRELDVLVLPPGFAAKIFGYTLPPEHRADGADRPLEIAVEPVGGTLTLGADAGESPEPSVVIHADAMVGVEHFARWSRLLDHAARTGEGIRIPQLEPGWYRLCPRSLLAPEGAQGPGSCDEGFLSAGGELRLSIRSNPGGAP